jgi:hypothetical protein
MKRIVAIAVLGLAMVAAAIPATAGAAAACTNTSQAAPWFSSVSDTSFFVLNAFPFPGGAAWVYKTGVTAPWAVLTSTLPAATQANPQLRTFAGAYTLICNLDTGWTPRAAPTTGWIDSSGGFFPSGLPFVNAGVGIPGIFRVATLG